MQKVALVTLALACLAVANPARRNYGRPCNTGSVQCCNHVEKPGDLSTQTISELGLLGIALGAVKAPVGVKCSPLNVIGAGSNSCTQQTVCCENNSFNGVVALGCTPINLNA